VLLCVATTCTPPRWQRQRRLRPHPTPYAETEAEAHNERILRCWARTKQIDVANAGGRVLPLFFAISPCACGPPCSTTRHSHTHTHPHPHTHTYDTAMLCFILHPRLPHSLFIPRSSPSTTVRTTTSFILYVYAYIYIYCNTI